MEHTVDLTSRSRWPYSFYECQNDLIFLLEYESGE